MKRTSRSIFSILIAVAMIFTALPASAFASESGCACAALCDGENINADCPVCAEDYTICEYEDADEGEQDGDGQDEETEHATEATTATDATTAEITATSVEIAPMTVSDVGMLTFNGSTLTGASGSPANDGSWSVSNNTLFLNSITPISYHFHSISFCIIVSEFFKNSNYCISLFPF